jgi:hypothetical protein
MNVNLCQRFPALDPFRVRAQRFHDVLLIFRRLSGKAENQNKLPEGATVKNGIVRRPAQNDDWY